MDSFAAALEKCGTDFGFEVSKLESIDPAGFEDDIRAIANEGADLIMTTFPPMTPAQITVAKEFPDTKFRAIYQFINMPGDAEILPNVESTEYQGQTVAYVLGVLAGSLTKSGKLGAVSGSDDPTVNAADNAWAAGALSVNPNITVEFGVANSYEDPAKGKEIALAMASRGVDVISTEAAKTQLGVIDGAKESKVLVQGDVANNANLYPEGYVGYLGLDFGSDVYLACKELHDGTWTGGTHTVLDLTTNTYYVPWDVIDAWAKVQTFTDADTAAKAIAAGKAAEAAIRDGSLVPENNTATPVNIGG
jgi:basic membrane protein A and related proteins